MTDERYKHIYFPDRVEASEEASRLFPGSLGPVEIDPGDNRKLSDIIQTVMENGGNPAADQKAGMITAKVTEIIPVPEPGSE